MSRTSNVLGLTDETLETLHAFALKDNESLSLPYYLKLTYYTKYLGTCFIMQAKQAHPKRVDLFCTRPGLKIIE